MQSILKRLGQFASLEIAIAIAIFLLAFGLIRQQYAEQARQLGAQHEMALNVAYHATLDTYRLEVGTRYQLQVLRPEILDLMQTALTAPESALPLLRERLKHDLQPLHDDLKRNGLLQFQFHLVDDRVLLRMHMPEQYGDPLYALRPLLRRANETQQPMFGFEVGHYLSSFRYIYPLGRQGEHYGSVEFALPFDQIQEKVAKLLPASEFGLLLNRRLIERNIDGAQQKRFVASGLNPDYVIEHPTKSRVSAQFVASKMIASLEPLLRDNPDVARRMAAGETFTIPVLHHHAGHIVTFLPLSGNDGPNAGYIIRFTATDSLLASRNTMLLETGIALLLVLALALAIRRLRRQQVLLQEDIARRQATEAELENHRQRLEEEVAERSRHLTHVIEQLTKTMFAMDSVGIGIAWVNVENGHFEYANRHMAEFLGYSVEEILRLGVSEIDPGFSRESFLENVRTIQARGHLKFETTHRRKDGQIIPVEMTVFYQRGSADSAPALIAFMVDITERKRHEASLLEAKRIAESATAAKSAFLANTSHEIRTPLNAITGMVHLMRRAGLDPEQGERLDKLEAASEHLLSVINAILDLSKIEAGKFVLEEMPVQVDHVLDNVVSILRERAAAKQLDLRMASSEFPAHLIGDATRLQQALLNYVGNAIKFTEHGSITVRARVIEETAREAVIRFEVQDTGIGISADTIGRLFTAFEQADNSTTRQYGGTGLGLAITRKIAQLMQGEAGAESTPGQGSTFWFSVRLNKVDGTDEESSSDGADAPEAVLQREFSTARVLLVDDEPINREITQMLLGDVGILADQAEDGRQAVQAAKDHDYAVILMDMQMPVMDGLTATREIRAGTRHRQTPIIAMTANAFNEDKARCLAAGMNDFITKPVNPEHLFATLLHWLQQARQGKGN